MGPLCSWRCLRRHLWPVTAVAAVAIYCLGFLPAAGTGVPDRWGQLGDAVSLPDGPWIQAAADVSVDGNHLCARLRKEDGKWAPRSCVFMQPGQAFENADGLLRIQRVLELPGGSWNNTARNIRREGDLLFAELLKEDLTWNKVAVVVGEHMYYRNVNGELWRQNSGCLSLGACPRGFSLKEDAFTIYCAALACDPKIDLERCCDEAMPCNNVDFCIQPLVIDTDAYCNGMTCDAVRDFRTCCVDKARCSTFDCPYGFTHAPDPYNIICASAVCDEFFERDLCCARQARCYDLGDYSCDYGRYFNPMEFCAGTTCEADRDLGACCPEAKSCEKFDCPNGYTPMPNSSAVFCGGATCVVERDTEACCLPAMHCDNISDVCGVGLVVEADSYCYGVTCFPERDAGHCCQNGDPCTSLNETNCTLGHFFNFTDYCDGIECQEERDRDICCQIAEPCSHYTCPYGHAARDNPLVWLEVGEPPVLKEVESLYCEGLHCDLDRDLPTCCYERAVCTTFECPIGWISTWNVSEQLCFGEACDEVLDLDTCCDPRGKCEEEYTCPHGFVGRPAPVWCDNVACVGGRDHDNCCEEAMPCTALTCPENYVQRPDSYCTKAERLGDIACTMEADKDMCCVRGMALEFYRFHAIHVRDPRMYEVQLSEFNLYFLGSLAEGSKANFGLPEQGASAFSPGGKYPLKESPVKAIDTKLNTKWLDEAADAANCVNNDRTCAWKPLVVQLPKAGPIDAYSFTTADDVPARDAVTWRVEGSPDNQTWVLLHSAEDYGDQVSEDRFTETPRWGIEVPCFLPLPVHIENSNQTSPCREGDITSNGLPCTAQCEPGYQPVPEILYCRGGELEPKSFKCFETG